VQCVPAQLPDRDAPASVLRLVLGDGHSQELGPFPGRCSAATEPGALCAVRCGEGPDARVLKAGWDGARLAVWTRPADQPDTWTRFWVESGPVVPR
jgi:hypothetical protein